MSARDANLSNGDKQNHGENNESLMEGVLVYFKENFGIDEPVYLLPILLSCLLVLVTIFVTFLRKRSHKGTNLLLLGTSNSGKTLLYCKLILKQNKETYISIKENRGTFNYKDNGVSKSVNVVDLPGQESIRSKFFEQLKDSAKGIIFLVDSASIQKDIKDVAEFLYTILIGLNGYQLPFLIACNKQDVELAKSSNFIKSALEKELTHVRQTHSSALQGLDGKTASQVLLGNPRKEFAFSDLTKINVEFVEVSAKSDNLSAVEKWIAKL